MTNLDATTIAQQAQVLGLLSDTQLEEGWEEVGRGGDEPGPLLRALERKGYLTPWQSQKLLKGETDGYFLGGYELLYKIASGSFGRVFRAEDPQTGRVVAVKVLRKRWSDDPHNIELFEREGKVGLVLQHPNIVEVLNVHRDSPSGQYYIVMEFVEGGNLRDFITIRKKIEPAEALRIMEDVTLGLVHAYARGLTHRDIKPTNILISSQGTAKLVDFGLAKICSVIGSTDDNVERTVDYAGLEKATCVPPGDVRSDLYFLGCVLYEMLTGRPPLLMSRDKQVRMQKQRFDNAPPMRPDEVTGPPSLFRLVETMMSLNAQQRYQTPSQLLEAIRGVRREIEGKGTAGGAGPRTVFVVESDERLQNALRDKFKELGYRVLLSADPSRALDRFRQQPFDVLVLDAGTTGEEGRSTFERIMAEADQHKAPCAGILLFSEEQADLAKQVPSRPTTAVMVRPVTLKQVYRKLMALVPMQKPT